jgi:hypothetical protein
MMRAILAAACAVLLALPAAAQHHRFEPVDEAAKDASWTAFRARLLKALQARDRKFVLDIVDRNVRNSFGQENGLAEFRRQWEPDAADSPLWPKLSSALFLGSAYVAQHKGPVRVCAPYVLPKWPVEIDPHGHGAITVRETLLKAAPDATSPTLQTLSHEIVAVLDWEVADRDPGVRQRWVKVRARAGEGYVAEEHVRSPLEHTACFARGAGGWRLVALVAGEL